MPPAIEDLEKDLQAEVDSDQDAEGEEETDMYQMDAQLQNAVHQEYSGEMAEEGENRQAGNYEPAGDADADRAPEEAVGAVKRPGDASSSEGDDAVSEGPDADADPAFENDGSSSNDESDAEEEDWEGESNDHDDAADNAGRGNCM